MRCGGGGVDQQEIRNEGGISWFFSMVRGRESLVISGSQNLPASLHI